MEAAFGDSQEMVAFITELNANYYSLWFIRENGSDQYYRHNKGLLFDDRQKMLLGQMEEVENILNRIIFTIKVRKIERANSQNAQTD